VDALSADTGNPAWSQTVQGDSAYGSFVAVHGVVYVGTCIKGNAACGSLMVNALDGSSGAPEWRHDNGGGSGVYLQVTADRVYVATQGTDQYQQVTILDAHSGAPLPNAPLSCQWADVFSTSTVAYESCSLDHPAVAAFDPTSGQQQWEQQTLQNGGQTFISVQAVADGLVYLDDDNQAGAEGGNQVYHTAYALDASTGAIRWQMDGRIADAASGIAVVTSTDRTCMVMGPSSTTPMWQFHAGGVEIGTGTDDYWPSVLIG
jgi:outer membrane protein assembly factor BamB